MKFAKFLKTSFFTEHLQWLLVGVLEAGHNFKVKLFAKIVSR